MTQSRIMGAVAIALCVTVATANAQQVSDRVRSHCVGDFMGYCSGSANAQQAFNCMLKFGPRLSRPCLGALIKEGYVTRAEVLRRARGSSALTSDICPAGRG